MLLNDVTRNDKMNTVHARDLQNAVVRHHQNNPHVSMEAAFEYIMSISSTYRALPTACIEKARRYLALPETLAKDVYTPRHGIETVNHLVSRTNDLSYYGFYEGSSLGYIFNCVLGTLVQSKKVNKLDVINAKNRLGLSTALLEPTEVPLYIKFPVDSPQNKPSSTNQKEQAKPGTIVVHAEYPGSVSNAISKNNITKVHAERVVVDNRKMIKILEFKNVRKARTLPEEYVYGMPRFYESNDGVVFARFENPSTVIKAYHPSNVITQTEFGKMIKTMKEAGARLTKINKTAKLEKEHCGKFTVSI